MQRIFDERFILITVSFLEKNEASQTGKGILRHIHRILIRFFEPFRPNSASKLAKSANRAL
jgi:hypothetical protein